jgi:hypothetical protein
MLGKPGIVPPLLLLTVLPCCLGRSGRPGDIRMSVDAGAVVSARSDVGACRGWTVAAHLGSEELETCGPGHEPVGVLYTVIDVSQLTPDDGSHEVWTAQYGVTMLGLVGDPAMLRYGYVAHYGGEGHWGVGLRAGLGLIARNARVHAYLLPSLSLWLGARDDAFDAGVDAEMRAVVGLRW